MLPTYITNLLQTLKQALPILIGGSVIVGLIAGYWDELEDWFKQPKDKHIKNTHKGKNTKSIMFINKDKSYYWEVTK